MAPTRSTHRRTELPPARGPYLESPQSTLPASRPRGRSRADGRSARSQKAPALRRGDQHVHPAAAATLDAGDGGCPGTAVFPIDPSWGYQDAQWIHTEVYGANSQAQEEHRPRCRPYAHARHLGRRRRRDWGDIPRSVRLSWRVLESSPWESPIQLRGGKLEPLYSDVSAVTWESPLLPCRCRRYCHCSSNRRLSNRRPRRPGRRVPRPAPSGYLRRAVPSSPHRRS